MPRPVAEEPLFMGAERSDGGARAGVTAHQSGGRGRQQGWDTEMARPKARPISCLIEKA